MQFIPTDEIEIEDDPNPEFRIGEKVKCPHPSCDKDHIAVVKGVRDDGVTIIVQYSDRNFDELLFINSGLRKVN